jgi:hypothetical protein
VECDFTKCAELQAEIRGVCVLIEGTPAFPEWGFQRWLPLLMLPLLLLLSLLLLRGAEV